MKEKPENKALQLKENKSTGGGFGNVEPPKDEEKDEVKDEAEGD